MASEPYIGRFAPSPTGELHFGSLVTALASYLDARHNQGLWLLRIEDLDPPRESRRAPKEIMAQLRSCGLEWDREVIYQSSRRASYHAHLQQLSEKEACYPCTCIRKKTPKVYPGLCRTNTFESSIEPFAIRLRMDDSQIEFRDFFYGFRSYNCRTEIGDFIIRRKDGLIAYQLAVITDDALQGVTHIIRGSDLLACTAKQIFLAKKLTLAIPSYGHIPVVVNKQGQKLSKQSHAKPIDKNSPLYMLRLALRALGQDPQKHATNTRELLTNAINDWGRHLVPETHYMYSPK